MRNLYDAGYNAEELREIFRLIDWMMHLRPDLSEQFESELTQLEEELQMPYVTSVERIAEARGKAEGKAEMVVRVLRSRIGSLPKKIVARIRRLPAKTLDALGDQATSFQELNALENWLDANKE